jgi:predicted ester cyclase
MAPTNKEIVLRLIDEVANAANLKLVDELVHADFFSHELAASRGCGPRAVKETIRLLHEAFAGFRVACSDVIAEGGKVAVRARVSGRHVGEFHGLPPTGHEWSVQQIHIVRLVGGKLIEHWASRDDLGALRQLGVLPESARSLSAAPRRQQEAHS